jgi:hypothetical protein
VVIVRVILLRDRVEVHLVGGDRAEVGQAYVKFIFVGVLGE